MIRKRKSSLRVFAGHELRERIPRLEIAVNTESLSRREKIVVIIADPDKMVCRLLSSFLQRNPWFDVAACVSDQDCLLRSVKEIKANVVLISTGIEEGPFSGLEVIRQVLELNPQLRVVLLPNHPTPQLVVEALRSGARGVFHRFDFDSAALCKCVRRVYQGQLWLNQDDVEHLINGLRHTPRLQVVNSAGSNLLSVREEDVMRLVAEGFGNREIAEKLHLSQHTIKNYLFHIFNKLGISNRVELVLHAMANPKEAQSVSDANYSSARKLRHVKTAMTVSIPQINRA